jgi:MSHA biogenesis protein MshO
LELTLKDQRGFTLVELITVMVILGVLASFSTTFVVSVMRSTVDISQKNRLLSNTQLATGYMVRRLRNALPFSLRVINDGACIQFMPIVASGLYMDILPSEANGAFPSGSFTPITVSPFLATGGSADFLAIAASHSDELYGADTGSLALIDTVTSNTITLNDDKRWLRNSINQRFYIVESPSAFCLFNQELRLYRDISISNVLVDPSGDYDLLSLSVNALNDPFTISSAVEARNILMTASLVFSVGSHRINSVKQVVVRNVP